MNWNNKPLPERYMYLHIEENGGEKNTYIIVGTKEGEEKRILLENPPNLEQFDPLVREAIKRLLKSPPGKHNSLTLIG